MATAATSGYGTTIKIGDGAGSETFTTVAEVTNISGPSFKLDTVDVTNMDSSGAWREHIATLKDIGDIQVDFNFLPANATQGYAGGALLDLVNRTRPRNFKITFSNTGATAWTIPGIVVAFEPGASVDGKLSGRMTIKGTGAPTLA